MKAFKFSLPVLTLIITAFRTGGCKKDCTSIEATANTVAGLWIGTYTVDQAPAQGALYYGFVFKPDNTLITESRGGDGNLYHTRGTWSLSGNALNCNYTSLNFGGATVTQSAKLTFTTTSDSLSAGTWKDVSGGSGYTGKFQVMKKVK